MFRFTSALVASFALISTSPLYAADYGTGLPDEFRTGYPSDWDKSDVGDPLDFEFGMRYFYSMGSHELDVAGSTYRQSDTSHTVEIHGRIDDNSTSTYLKGVAGYAAAIDSNYTTPLAPGGFNAQLGKIAYAGADFGYLGLGNDAFKVGGFIGYQYWNDSPYMGRRVFTNASGSDSVVNDLNYNILRLGAVVHAELGNKIDLNVEAAFVPYARLDGTYGGFSIGDFGGATQASAGNIEGNLWGAGGEVMLGFHPTDNLTIRGGGRAWYLTGPTTTQFTMYNAGTGTTSYVANSSNFSTLRYGALVELTYSF